MLDGSLNVAVSPFELIAIKVRTPPERRIQTLFKKGRILAWPKLAALCFAMIVADLPLAHFSGGGQTKTLYFYFQTLGKTF